MLEFRMYHTHISIFPAFYSVNRRATIPHELAQSYFKGNGIVPRANHFALSIYLIDSDSSDMPSIYAFAWDMAVSFPRIFSLDLWFERRCDIVSFLLTVNDYNRT